MDESHKQRYDPEVGDYSGHKIEYKRIYTIVAEICVLYALSSRHMTLGR